MARNENQLKRNAKTITPQEQAVVRNLLTRVRKIAVNNTPHAVQRLEERGITVAQMQNVLDNANYNRVVEVSIVPRNNYVEPRMLITSNEVYGVGNGRYRVAVVVNCHNFKVVTTYKAFLRNNYKTIQNDNFNFANYFAK
jgi:hypothetical protein